MLDGIKTAVLFAAHSDDEMICAGTLHRLVESGADVHVMTFGPAAIEQDRQGGHASELIVKDEWHAALTAIGVRSDCRHWAGLLPSSELPKFRQQICQRIYDFCEFHRPDLVLTLSPDDENTAHAVVGVEAERVMRGRVPISVRCLFPWNFSIGRPNLFVKLSEQDLTVKRRVIEAYESQAFRYQYHEMLTAYCRADGLSVKTEAAEKFEIVRCVV